jgi:hypothetical protein
VLTPHLWAIQWPPNFKVSNVDKYEAKQDPGSWLAVYTTATRAAGATEDMMMTYLPILLGQDALQWLQHLPRHCIDDWSDFIWRFIANFQSLSNKPAQPWDLKSIRRQNDETLRSFLKRFQTMRNRILEVTEAAVIQDFYRGSNDSAFVRAILQKAPATSKQLFWEADIYITMDERAHDLIRGTKSAPPAPRRDVNQQPDRRWEKRPHEEVHTAEPPAARARGAPRGGVRTLDEILDAQCQYTRTCATPYGTAGTSSIPSGMANHSSLYHIPCHEESLASLGSLSSSKGGGGAFTRIDREVNVIFGGHEAQENRRQQKLNGGQVLVATTSAPALYWWSEHTITFIRADQCVNFDHPGKYPLLVDPVIRESRVKKVLGTCSQML